MPTGLDVSRVVRVDVTLTPRAIPTRNFGVPIFVGSSEVIDVYERRRQYTTISQVAEDFGTTTDEYKAASKFFAQNPQPALCLIGRWAQTETSGILYSGVLAPEDQLIQNFTSVTAGAFFIFIDGVPKTVAGLNFSSQTNLNGIVGVVNDALDLLVTNTTAVWLPNSDRFKLESGTTGVGSKLSWGAPPTAWGSVAFSGQPANNDIITIAGTGVKFVTGAPGVNEVQISATDLAHTLQNLLEVLDNSTDVNLMTCNYLVTGTTLYIMSNVTGVAGNDITLVETTDTGNVMTLGNLIAGKLSGGSGTDISALFHLRSADGAPSPVDGVDSETALEAAAIHADGSHVWYALEFVTTVQPTLQEHEDVAGFIESASPSRTYWYTTGDSEVLDPLTDGDLASAMKVLNLARTCGQYSTTAPTNAIASLFGRFANVDFRQNNSCITAKFKREPGVVAETLSETQAQTVDDKHINVFVNYDVDVAIVEEGVMANGDFIDERIGCDWLQNALQVALFNVLYTSPTKIPQTDAGTQILVTACKVVLQAGVFNGFIAPGMWNGPPLGQINTGDLLTTGFYVFAPSVNTQSQADREARKSVPIQIAVKLAGAVHSVICSVWVNR